jgi:hypothetical protein
MFKAIVLGLNLEQWPIKVKTLFGHFTSFKPRTTDPAAVP